MRSAFAPVVVGLAALIAALGRWYLQGSNNIYTAPKKRFYVPELDGWVLTDRAVLWLGLELIAAIAAITVALVIGGWLIRRRERKLGARSTILRVIAWLAAVGLVGIPLAAFLSGGRPPGGEDIRPIAEAPKLAPPAPTGPAITGSLDLPAGRYEVVAPHKSTSISVRLEAGGDVFDAVFVEVKGEWRADPKDLTQPMTAEVTAATASVDAGIEMRSKHAREDYLKAPKFPRMGWKLEKLVQAKPEGDKGEKILFKATGTATLMDKTHAVEVTGSLKKADAAALKVLGLTGAVLIVDAGFSLVIKETSVAASADTFTGDRFPIHTSLVLRHTGDK